MTENASMQVKEVWLVKDYDHVRHIASTKQLADEWLKQAIATSISDYPLNLYVQKFIVDQPILKGF